MKCNFCLWKPRTWLLHYQSGFMGNLWQCTYHVSVGPSIKVFSWRQALWFNRCGNVHFRHRDDTEPCMPLPGFKLAVSVWSCVKNGAFSCQHFKYFPKGGCRQTPLQVWAKLWMFSPPGNAPGTHILTHNHCLTQNEVKHLYRMQQWKKQRTLPRIRKVPLYIKHRCAFKHTHTCMRTQNTQTVNVSENTALY